MPTLEIVSIDTPYSNDWGDYTNLKYLALPRLESERGIFQDDLNQLRGVLVRLGRTISDDGCSTEDSYELIDGKQVDRDITELKCARILRFLPGVAADVIQLMSVALQRSPVGQSLFLSDYQLAGDRKSAMKMSQSEFDNLILRGQLIFNTQYLVRWNKATQ